MGLPGISDWLFTLTVIPGADGKDMDDHPFSSEVLDRESVGSGVLCMDRGTPDGNLKSTDDSDGVVVTLMPFKILVGMDVEWEGGSTDGRIAMGFRIGRRMRWKFHVKSKNFYLDANRMGIQVQRLGHFSLGRFGQQFPKIVRGAGRPQQMSRQANRCRSRGSSKEWRYFDGRLCSRDLDRLLHFYLNDRSHARDGPRGDPLEDGVLSQRIHDQRP